MKYKRISEKSDLDIAFDIRIKVFVEEQECTLEEEFDEYDHLEADVDHILVYHDQQPVGTGRVRIVGDTAKLERICLLVSHRDIGLGKVVVSSLEEIAKSKGYSKAKLHAQTVAEGFYKKLGYKTNSEIFMQANIPHILMIKNL